MIDANKLKNLIYYKKRREIAIIEVGITSSNWLFTMGTKKKRKYEILVNKLRFKNDFKNKNNIIYADMKQIVRTFYK